MSNPDRWNVGNDEPPTTHACHICGGPWNLPMPVKAVGESFRYGAQKFLPHPGGLGLCWDCWDKART